MRSPHPQKPTSLNYASMMIAFSMIMAMIGLAISYSRNEELSIAYVAFLAAIGGTAITNLRYLLDLEKGKPGVRRIHCISIVIQLAALTYAHSAGLLNPFLTIAVIFDVMALVLMYYPTTTHWLESVRYHDDA